MLGGIYFWEAARTTLGFAAVTVPLLIVLGILTALLLNESFVGNTLSARGHAPALGAASHGRRAGLEVDLSR